MCIFSHYGVNNFFILTGYKSLDVKKYFLNDIYSKSDLKINYKNKSVEFFEKK